MIPQRLKLTNFLSHSNTEIDLSQVKKAVVTGPNGHGKSSLVDGLCYALFGQTPRYGTSQDKAIRGGETSMSVEYIFRMGPQDYRIIRSRSTSPEKTQLQFDQLVDGTWKPLAGGIRETQETIEQTIGMDYATIVNSCILVQGKSDEFSNRRPGERKDVLLKILGLDFLERAAQAARQAQGAQKQSLESYEREIARLRAVVDQKGELTESLGSVTNDLNLAEDEAGIQETAKDALVQSREAAKQTMAGFADLKRQKTELGQRLLGLTTEREQIGQDITVREAIVEKADDIRACEAKRTTLERELRAQVELSNQYSNLSQMRTNAQSERNRLQGQRACDEAAALNRLTVRKNKEQANLDMARNAKTHAKLKHEQFYSNVTAERDAHKRGIENHIGSLESLIETLGNQASLIETVPCAGTEHNTSCSLLAQARNARVEKIKKETDLERERKELADEPNWNYTSTLAEAKATLDNPDRWPETAAIVAAEAVMLDEPNWPESIELARAQAELKADNPHDAEVTILDQQIAALGYDAAKHDDTKRAFEQLNHIPDEVKRLERFEVELQGKRELLGAKLAEIKTAEELHTSLVGQLSGEEEAARKLGEIENALTDCQVALETARTRLRQLQGRKAQIETQIKQITEAENSVKLLENEMAEGRKHLERLERVAFGWGKNGVQAMLIEQAIPLLEEESNRILARLTDGMSITIETQKATKQSVAETLDIIITDEAGRKPYEGYSGGERFRVDFAMRFALSNLLAHRAGAKIETLIIDEGFGSQDPEGLARLLDCLDTIQDEFKCIIVVSHIEEMKEAFPCRIHVQKSAQGSTVSVIQ